MAKIKPVRIPLDFEQVVSDLLKVKPPQPKASKRKTAKRRAKRKSAS